MGDNESLDSKEMWKEKKPTKGRKQLRNENTRLRNQMQHILKEVISYI